MRSRLESIRRVSGAAIRKAKDWHDRQSRADGVDPSELESVARAICLANRDDPDKEWLLADGRRDVMGWQTYEDDARAAIAAMCKRRKETAR